MCKQCKKCEMTKPLSDFYAHKGMMDGHLNICIQCVKNRVLEYREINIDKIRAYDRKRGRTKKRMLIVRERSRAYRKQKRIEAQLRWMERNPEKRAAHTILQSHLKKGTVMKGKCEVCGKVKVEGHHDDYSQPLVVRWLCRKHHAELHRKYKI